MAHVEDKSEVVPGDGIHDIFGLCILLDEMMIAVCDLFVSLLELFDVFEEDVLVGAIFEELFPEGGDGVDCLEDCSEVFIVVKLEVHIFVCAIAEGFLDLGSV